VTPRSSERFADRARQGVDEAFHFDPFDPRQTQNMWQRFREIRERQPLSRPGDFVFVARYGDALEVLRQPLLFGSAQGFRAPGVVVPLEDRLVGELDPPQHQPIRRLLTSILVPSTVRRAVPFTRGTARKGLESLARRGGGDLVSEFTLLLPTQVTVHVLGLPVDDSPKLAHWAEELLESDWPASNRTERGEGLDGAFPEYAAYIDRHVALRRGSPDPPDDPIGELVRKQVFDRPISDRQIRALVSNLILGGISTSTSLLGNLFHHLISHPEHQRALREDPGLAVAAVEESLRLAPPVLYVVRTCTRDTELSGFGIREGERVIVSLASANRDDDVYPDADTFRLDRHEPRPHLGFSAGPHRCVGAGLARMVGRVVLEEFTGRFRAGQVALESDFVFEATPVFLEFGPKRLPVTIAA
jgi:cytochrome P450